MTSNLTAHSSNWLAGGPRLLQLGAVGYAAGMTIHGADHLIRGIRGSGEYASWPAGLQVFMGFLTLAFSGVAMWTALKEKAYAAWIGVVVGFGSGVTFLVIHLLPAWADFTDSFISAPSDAQVTSYSWVTASFGIAMSFVYGLTGLAAQFPACRPAPRS